MNMMSTYSRNKIAEIEKAIQWTRTQWHVNNRWHTKRKPTRQHFERSQYKSYERREMVSWTGRKNATNKRSDRNKNKQKWVTLLRLSTYIMCLLGGRLRSVYFSAKSMRTRKIQTNAMDAFKNRKSVDLSFFWQQCGVPLARTGSVPSEIIKSIEILCCCFFVRLLISRIR